MSAVVYVYRLHVTYPDGSRDPWWEPKGWEPEFDPNPNADDRFRWPSVRQYLSSSAAERRANLLRKYGATVVVERSEPVTFARASSVGAAE